MSKKYADFSTTCTYQSNIRLYLRESVILAMTYLKYDSQGCNGRMASHGNLEITTADKIFAP